MPHISYKSKFPALSVRRTGGANLGRCYNASYYEVRADKKLKEVDFDMLREMGFLGYGQEFMVNNVPQIDIEMCPAQEIDKATGVVLNEHPVREYTGEPYTPYAITWYVYTCEARVDSSD